MRYALLATLFLGVPEGEVTAWVFFSPDSPDASRIFAELRAASVPVRPVLLVERYFGDREPAEPFLASIQSAGEVRVVDDEGLREAARLSIRDLPAVAVVRGGRTHVASGTRADVKELLRCAK
jgi:hypothetical protein